MGSRPILFNTCPVVLDKDIFVIGCHCAWHVSSASRSEIDSFVSAYLHHYLGQFFGGPASSHDPLEFIRGLVDLVGLPEKYEHQKGDEYG